MKYRPEIDGLRSIAILPVLLFHGGVGVFSGGYVGVDVFFVISGYLITTILLGDLSEGRFSLLRFYERRARRILPVLFVVMAACIPPALLWMLPNALRDFSQSLIAVSVFASNILFAREEGYFAAAADEKPLLHTWSLAVEEQYYVIFPILLFLLWRTGRNRTFVFLILLTMVSFYFSEFSIFAFPKQHFYFSPSRAWELLSGSLCAFLLFNRPVHPNNLLSLTGLGLIAYAIFAFTADTPFPSAYTLAPVVGTGLIILFCGRHTWLGKFLSLKIPVGIGLISYSLYLWHQPLFAFARIRTKLPPSQELMLALIAASFALAYLTWRFVEQPVRRRTIARSRIAVFASSSAAIFIFIAVGTVGHFQLIKGNWEVPPNAKYESMKDRTSALGSVCRAEVDESLNGFIGCAFGDLDAKHTVILYGDSHAQAISQRLRDRFASEGLKGLFITGTPGCGVELLTIADTVSDPALCERNYEKLKDLLKRRADAIILMSRWTQHLYPIAGSIDSPSYTNEAGIEERSVYREYTALDQNGKRSFGAEAKKAASQRYVNELVSIGKPVVLIYPIPATAWNIFKLNAYEYNIHGTVPEEITISAPRYLKRNELILEWFDALNASNLIKVPIFDLFCTAGPTGRCKIQENAIPLYDDDDHLSYEGTKRVVDPVVEILKARL